MILGAAACSAEAPSRENANEQPTDVAALPAVVVRDSLELHLGELNLTSARVYRITYAPGVLAEN